MMAKLVDKNGNALFPTETGTVTSELATAPYFNKNMEFEGGAILRVANTPVGYACCSVTKEGRIRAIHSEYSNQVQFIGSVVVMLE